MDLLTLFSFVAKAAVVFVALAVTVACSAAFEAFTVVIFESTYVFTAFCVGNKISLVPNVVVVDLLTLFSFKFNAVWVAIEIGLLLSEVLSTLLICKLIFASVKFVAPVPPFWICITPETLFAVTAAYAKGTAESGLSLKMINCWQVPLTSNCTFNFLIFTFQTIVLNELAYPPVWFPDPIIKLTIPNSSVVVGITSWYSNCDRLSVSENCKQTDLFDIGLFWISTPGIFCPLG